MPGEFNNWGNNNSGRIDVNDESLMIKDNENDFWYKMIPLVVGGGRQQKMENLDMPINFMNNTTTMEVIGIGLVIL